MEKKKERKKQQQQQDKKDELPTVKTIQFSCAVFICMTIRSMHWCPFAEYHITIRMAWFHRSWMD